ncbi:MAG: chalcone isomerase family protein [Thiotrichales bacterium]|nr:chalcone isomerase family protein [Thiotrichales bacterium]
MKFLTLSVIALLTIFSRPVFAVSETGQTNPTWHERSKSTATWMWFDIYNATLFTQPGFNQSKLLDDDQPLKLKLCYLKPIGREDLIKGAEAVLDKELAPNLKQAVSNLHQSYVDVKPGDCYVLEYQPSSGTQLKLNDQLAFETKQSGFKSVYFGIWLGQNPLSDSLKEALLTPLEKGAKPLS